MLARLAHFQYPEQARRQRGSTVEQLICNQRVAGSIPVAGSRSMRSPVPSRCRAFCCRAIETSSVADFRARCSRPPRRRSRFRHRQRRRATFGRSAGSERTKPARVSRRDGCAGCMRQLCRVKLSHARTEAPRDVQNGPVPYGTTIWHKTDPSHLAPFGAPIYLRRLFRKSS